MEIDFHDAPPSLSQLLQIIQKDHAPTILTSQGKMGVFHYAARHLPENETEEFFRAAAFILGDKVFNESVPFVEILQLNNPNMALEIARLGYGYPSERASFFMRAFSPTISPRFRQNLFNILTSEDKSLLTLQNRISLALFTQQDSKFLREQWGYLSKIYPSTAPVLVSTHLAGMARLVLIQRENKGEINDMVAMLNAIKASPYVDLDCFFQQVSKGGLSPEAAEMMAHLLDRGMGMEEKSQPAPRRF